MKDLLASVSCPYPEAPAECRRSVPFCPLWLTKLSPNSLIFSTRLVRAQTRLSIRITLMNWVKRDQPLKRLQNASPEPSSASDLSVTSDDGNFNNKCNNPDEPWRLKRKRTQGELSRTTFIPTSSGGLQQVSHPDTAPQTDHFAFANSRQINPGCSSRLSIPEPPFNLQKVTIFRKTMTLKFGLLI